ncbi:MAG: sugar nucleotide-binding protein [Myxococcota bacterium]
MFVIVANKVSVADDIAAGLANEGHKVRVETEVDVTDMRTVRGLVAEYQPRAVLHMAFLDSVASCEVDVERAFLHNAESVINLVAATMEFHAVPIIWSPAQILGRGGTEDDEPQPNSTWTESRAKGEVFLMRAAPTGLIVRSGPLLSHDLSIEKERLRRGLTVGTVKVQPVLARWFGRFLHVALRAELNGVLHMLSAGPEQAENEVWSRIAEAVGLPTTGLRVDTAAGTGSAVLTSRRTKAMAQLGVPPAWTDVFQPASEAPSVSPSVGAKPAKAKEQPPVVVSERPPVWAWVFEAGETKTWTVSTSVLCRVVTGKVLLEEGEQDHVLKAQKAVHIASGSTVRVTAPTSAVVIVVEVVEL